MIYFLHEWLNANRSSHTTRSKLSLQFISNTHLLQNDRFNLGQLCSILKSQNKLKTFKCFWIFISKLNIWNAYTSTAHTVHSLYLIISYFNVIYSFFILIQRIQWTKFDQNPSYSWSKPTSFPFAPLQFHFIAFLFGFCVNFRFLRL